MITSVVGGAIALPLCMSLSTAALAATLQVQVNDRSGQPLADAVVFLDSRDAALAAHPLRDVAIAQEHKQFTPRVTVVTVGSAVDFPNRDTVRHHVYSFSPTKPFELKLYAGTPSNPVVFDRAGIAVLGCNIHDHMSAWVVVVETPYFGRSGSAGRVVLDNVPAGAYRLRTWHPALPVGAPAIDQAVTVAASGASLTVQLEAARP
jgi:plastocyanin